MRQPVGSWFVSGGAGCPSVHVHVHATHGCCCSLAMPFRYFEFTPAVAKRAARNRPLLLLRLMRSAVMLCHTLQCLGESVSQGVRARENSNAAIVYVICTVAVEITGSRYCCTCRLANRRWARNKGPTEAHSLTPIITHSLPSSLTPRLFPSAASSSAPQAGCSAATPTASWACRR